jgi:hypothetical protein
MLGSIAGAYLGAAMRLPLIGLMCLVLQACAASGSTINPYDDVARSASESPWSGPLAWMLDPAIPVTPEARTLHLLFAVPTCGSHGILTPLVEYRPSEVAIEMHMDDVGNCLQAGGPVKYDLDLTESVGQREVVRLIPTPSWPYRSLEEWGRIVSWSEIANPPPAQPAP